MVPPGLWTVEVWGGTVGRQCTGGHLGLSGAARTAEPAEGHQKTGIYDL